MIARYASLAREQPMAAAAMAISLIGVAALVGAWIFQYGFGLSAVSALPGAAHRLLRLRFRSRR